MAENAENAAPRTAGQTLAAERERQGLSRADVAQRLHMSAYQVEAIETGDFTRLPKGTFLRGFVRNYAKVLGLAADAVLKLLPESTPSEKKPGIVVPSQDIRFDPIGERLQSPYVKAAVIAVVVISIAFAGMYWWLFIRPKPPGAAPQRKPVAEAAPPVAAAAMPSSKPELIAKAPVAAAAPEPPKVEPRRVEPAKPPAEGSVLKFVFKGASWVEIRDAKGKLLLSKLNSPGSEAEVVGKPPFNVIVGNAPEVQLFYNDHEFDLEPHTKVAVARFTVE